MNKNNYANCLKWLLLILLTCQCGYTWAQFKITEINFGTDFVPASRYQQREDNLKDHPATTQYRYTAGLNFLLSSKTDTVTGKVRTWMGAVTGSYMNLQHRHYTDPVFPDELFTGDIGIQHYRSLRNRWGFMGILSVGLYSDLNKIDGHDLFISAGGIFIKHFTPNFSLGFGGLVNNSYGTPMLFPFLMVQWQLKDRYILNVNMPDRGPGLAYNISLTRKINDHYDLSLAFRPRQLTYDVERTSDNKRLMNYWELPVGLENRWHIGMADLFIGGGVIPLRVVTFGEKKLSKMFSDNDTHQLKANYYLKAGVQVKL